MKSNMHGSGSKRSYGNTRPLEEKPINGRKPTIKSTKIHKMINPFPHKTFADKRFN
jgi:hypothetical protein